MNESTSPTPHISIVIPFYNRVAEVKPCLDAVLGQNLPEDLFVEVVCVDNGSTDGTREELTKFPVIVIDCQRRGPAAARNAGIAAARGSIIAFTDSDCMPQPDWLVELIAPFEEATMLITGGVIKARTLEVGAARFAEEFRVLDQWSFFTEAPGFPPFFAMANCAMKRQAILDAGGFDDSLWMSEDADLCWRVLDVGGKIAFCPRALVRHSHRTTFDGLFRWGIDYGNGSAQVFAKHRDRFGKRAAIAWDCYPALAAAPLIILWNLIFGGNPYERRRPIYEAVWRTGYLWGRWKGALKNRVPYL